MAVVVVVVVVLGGFVVMSRYGVEDVCRRLGGGMRAAQIGTI